jgi:hypothetical protein
LIFQIFLANGRRFIKMAAAQDEAEGDAIIRVTTYHRRDYDEQAINFGPYVHAKVRHSIIDPFEDAPVSNLGVLETFPNELLQQICLELDMETLFKLRQVNRRAREVVTITRQYRAIADHALDAFLATLQTGAAKYITLTQLYGALTQKSCDNCGAFGGFLFIPTVTRCCLECMNNTTISMAFPLCHVKPLTDMGLVKLRRSLTVVRSVPGWYGCGEKVKFRRQEIVACSQALELVEAVHGAEKAAEMREHFQKSRWTSCCSESKPAVSVNMAFFDPVTSKAYRSYYCKGCGMDSVSRWNRRWDKAYSREEFLAHFSTCQQAQKLWSASRGGMRDVSYLDSEMVMNGGYATSSQRSGKYPYSPA